VFVRLPVCEFVCLFVCVFVWLCDHVAVRGLSLVASGGNSRAAVHLVLLWNIGSGVLGLQEFWHAGFAAPGHVGSSWTRDQSMSRALASSFHTTGPPEKSLDCF